MITIQQVQTTVGGRPARHLIIRDGSPIGLLEKYRDTSTDTHPWKAFVYIRPPGPNAETKYLGAWYRAEGGKRSALQAIIQSI